jgi:hypothetical protein
MKYNKDNQRETLIIEISAWIIILGIVYLLVKAAM